MIGADDLEARWEAIGNPNPWYLLIRLVKTMVREGRTRGTADDDIRADILGELAARAASQRPAIREWLAGLVRRAIKEALSEGPPDAEIVARGNDAARPVLDVFGRPEGMRS